VKLSPSSTCQEIREPDCYKASGWELGGHQLGLHWTPYLRQPGVGYVLSSTVPRYGYSRQPTSSCTVLDSLSAQAVHQPGHLLGRAGEDVLSESTSYILKFYFFLCCAILILYCTQEHFRLAEDISIEMANIVFDKATRKVIKDTIKHTCLVSTALYYS
jgi:hypothetical protein